MKVIVTGGAGFIGSNIVDELVRQGEEVIVIDDLSSGKEENLNKKARFYKQDIREFESLKRIFERERPEAVLHLAAQVNVRKSYENPLEDLAINVVGSVNVFELCKLFKVDKVVMSSTGGALYGDDCEIQTPEDAQKKQTSAYGCAKSCIENYLEYYHRMFGLNYCILRYANVYGPRQNPFGGAGVIAIFLKAMLTGKEPVIYGGVQTRDFVFVKDVVKANILALRKEVNTSVNIGTGKETDIIEIFNRLNKYFDGKIVAKYEKGCEGEQKRSCLDCGKAKLVLGWAPESSLEEGLDQTYGWFAGRVN